ncbi:MAG: DUF927 domain-containing protein [Pseudomonadota bacterium]
MPKPHIKNLATIHDLADELTYVRILLRTTRNKTKKIEVLRSETSDYKQLERRFLDAGAELPKAGEARRTFIVNAVEGPSQVQIRRLAQSGWLKSFKAFAVQSSIVGHRSQLFEGPKLGPNITTPQLRVTGTARSWRDSVGSLSRRSSYFMLSISAAFAAPLLKMVGEESFAICFSGSSRTGKSAATLAGASAIGFATKQEMLNWNISEAALGQQLALFNDCMVPLDDLENMKGGDAAKYEQIRSVTYGIAAGTEKVRHSHAKLPSNPWRTILITSMEKTIQDLSIAAKKSRNHGESVRMIDVPMLESGRTHIFDRAQEVGIKATGTWKVRRFANMNKACLENHGAAFRRHVSLLCRKPEAATTVKKYRERFVRTVITGEDGDVARDVARKFGLIYAGGLLATDFGLVPWKSNDVMVATRICYLAARSLLPDKGVAIRKGRSALHRFLGTLKRKREINDFRAEPGFVTKKGGQSVYLISVDAFNNAFASREDLDLTLNWLQQEKLIAMASVKSGPPRLKSQFSWPHGRRRSFKITLPPGSRLDNILTGSAT